MAKRANQTFVHASKDGKLIFAKDQIVPPAIARKVSELVYDDGAKASASAGDDD